MKIHILDRAQTQILDSARFYEMQSSGLGSYFRSSILEDIRRLRTTAGVHQVVLGKYHRSVSRRFPFGVYYRVEDDQIWVHAVLDSRRHPDWIRQQIK